MEDNTKNMKTGNTTNDAFARIGRLLDASPVRRGVIVPQFLMVVFIYFALINVYFYLYPSPFVQQATVLFSLQLDLVLIVLSLLLIYTKGWFEKNSFLQKLAPYVYSAFFAISLMIRGALVGHLSFILGVVGALAALFAIILFDLALVLFILIFGVLIFLLLMGLDYHGVIAYAPFFESSVMDTSEGRFFYGVFSVIVTLPFFICVIGFGAVLITYWRKREQDVRQMSMTDSLMAMYNRRAISEHLANTVAKNHLVEGATSIVMVDVDHFKMVNDTFGHHVGDKVLCQIGGILQQTSCGIAQVGRFGGEEFLIVLDSGEQQTAIELAERCRLNVQAALITDGQNNTVPVTASFGVYSATLSHDDPDKMLRKVDVQLYRAKEQGRNCVCY